MKKKNKKKRNRQTHRQLPLYINPEIIISTICSLRVAVLLHRGVLRPALPQAAPPAHHHRRHLPDLPHRCHRLWKVIQAGMALVMMIIYWKSFSTLRWQFWGLGKSVFEDYPVEFNLSEKITLEGDNSCVIFEILFWLAHLWRSLLLNLYQILMKCFLECFLGNVFFAAFKSNSLAKKFWEHWSIALGRIPNIIKL